MFPRDFRPPTVAYTDPCVLLEVIAQTVEDACEAEQGGAGRIELVRELHRGGLTPSVVLIEAVVKAVRIPVRVILRPSEAFTVGDADEPGRLHAAARAAYALGAAGFVVGFLRGGAPDVPAVQEVLGTLPGPATFHRAFDEADRPLEAVAALAVEARVDRVLTSGGAGGWDARLARLRSLRDAAPPHLTILPGGGLHGGRLRSLAEDGFSEAHVGRAARIPPDHDGRVSASRVAALVALAGGQAR
jgi:copper homeostasis protein